MFLLLLKSVIARIRVLDSVMLLGLVFASLLLSLIFVIAWRRIWKFMSFVGIFILFIAESIIRWM